MASVSTKPEIPIELTKVAGDTLDVRQSRLKMKTVSLNAKLAFTNLAISVKNKVILENVSGEVISGDLLAVMGSTGSGKTTLLNALAGRIPITAGDVTLNGLSVDKQQRRRFGYVIQEDIFLSNLTLWETLYVIIAGISEKVPKKEKLETINAIVECLGLHKCVHTGLSGGEKKRANIACELLADPDILLIDEPTFGLDSSTAHSLMKQLRNYATEYNKIILATIHQPSSQIFGMFSTLLLLSQGRTAYFGKADMAIDFVTGLGMIFRPNYNPPDFLLEMVTFEENAVEMIEENRKRNEWLMTYDGEDNKNQLLEVKTGKQGSNVSIELQKFKTHDSDQSLFSSNTTIITEEGQTTDHWPTSLWTQLRMLIWRSFKQSKGRMLHKFDLIQGFIIAAITGVLYFQIEQSPSTIRDQMGLVLFVFAYFGFEVMIMTIAGCCSDRGVYLKDRAAGAYRLSAFYLAKIISEMPLILIVPSLSNTAVYWVTGLGKVDGYFVFLGTGVLHLLLVQGLADVIGFSILDFKLCMTINNVLNIGGLLLGGFFNIHPPEWLHWAKYMAHVHYPYGVALRYLLGGIDPIGCNQTNTEIFPQCFDNSTDILTSRDVLAGIGIELPIYCYIMTIVFGLCVSRIFGYFILKFKQS